MVRRSYVLAVLLGGATLSALLFASCGNLTGALNPAFVNTFIGGSFPLTPGPVAPYILVRGANETGQTAEFIVTIEREIIETDDDGNFLFDEAGNPVTRRELQTIQLQTFATAPANDAGVLIDCSQFPVTRIGLGENLLPTDRGVFVGGAGPGGTAGVGIVVGNLNPLQLFPEGNFNCGDTVIFRAFQSTGVPGGVGLQSFLLPGSEQPESYSGPSTFRNYAQFIESQQREDEP